MRSKEERLGLIIVAQASELERTLIEVFVVFAAAKIMGQLFEIARQPAVVGELLAGVIVGPHVLEWIHLGQFMEALAELGVIFLLFEVGLNTKFSELREVGKPALLTAVLGMAIPFGLGWGAMLLTRHTGPESLFVATALVATSVGITARVLADLGTIANESSRVILGAAVLDDILGLALLAVVSGAAAGTLSGSRVAATIGIAATFVVFLATVGTRLMRRYPAWLEARLPHRNPVVVALMICLGLSALSAKVGLAAIVGAFMAGMVLAEAPDRYGLEKAIKPVNELLVPFFFVVTGAKLDLAAFTRPALLGLVALLTVLAVAGKVAAGMVGARRLGLLRSLIVGVGMSPRGEVGIIVASIGLASGTIGPRLYSVVVAMAVVTTLLAPPVLAILHRRDRPGCLPE